jgi:hypothetical protein
MVPFETSNILFNQSDAAVRDSFNAIHRFFKKAKAKKKKLPIDSQFLILKFIVILCMKMEERCKSSHLVLI